MALVTIPAGTLVAASDPITLSGSDVGAAAVVINANDVAVTGNVFSGLRPKAIQITEAPVLSKTSVRERDAGLLQLRQQHLHALEPPGPGVTVDAVHQQQSQHQNEFANCRFHLSISIRVEF